MIDITLILGICDSNDCGAVLLKDGKILGAVNEERLTRIKDMKGFPNLSVRYLLSSNALSIDDIDLIAVAGFNTPPFPERILRGNLKLPSRPDSFIQRTYLSWQSTSKRIHLQKLYASISKKVLQREISKFSPTRKIPLILFDHHLCHAAPANYMSPFKKTLTITLDGQGDGISSAIYEGTKEALQLRKYTSSSQSLGALYLYTTMELGFSKYTGSGKTMGLAAYGNPKETAPIFNEMISVSDCQIKTKVGGLFTHRFSHYMTRMRGQTKENIAAGIQKVLESKAQEYIQQAIQTYDCRNVCLSGGVALNVKMNQIINQMKDVDNLFIFPHPSDGGLALGAAILGYQWHCKKNAVPFRTLVLKDLYFGPEFSEESTHETLIQSKMPHEHIGHDPDHVARMISKGTIVGYFNHRMEYGPRALGNRSILADPRNKKIPAKINQYCNREQFMPFAPSVLQEPAQEYIDNLTDAPYMILGFNANKKTAKKIPAVVHVDQTVRPQTVDKAWNPNYYDILESFMNQTGIPMVMNTSFNMHNEPIVCSPSDALAALKKGAVDVLVMNGFLVRRK